MHIHICWGDIYGYIPLHSSHVGLKWHVPWCMLGILVYHCRRPETTKKSPKCFTRPCPAWSHQDHHTETILPFIPLFHSLFPWISRHRYVGKSQIFVLNHNPSGLNRSRLLTFVGFPLSPSLLGNEHFFETRSLSVCDVRRVHLVFGCRCVSKETVSSYARVVHVFMWCCLLTTSTYLLHMNMITCSK